MSRTTRTIRSCMSVLRLAVPWSLAGTVRARYCRLSVDERQSTWERKTQNSLPSGSARTTHVTSP
jgi:hypothetical protein